MQLKTDSVQSTNLRWYQGIDRKCWIILVVTFFGWLLDSMDLNLFTLVLTPSLTELLGANATPAAIGAYGGAIIAIQLLGWGIGGMMFGILGDYIGRSRALTLSIVVYSVFTALGALSNSWWTLAICRFMAAWGVGGEWGIGTSLINEMWPSRSRVKASAIMMSAFGAGYLIAGLVNMIFGSFGWRFVFLIGVLPAIIVAIIRRKIPESQSWEESTIKRAATKKRMKAGDNLTNDEKNTVSFTLIGLFKKPWRKNTIAGTLMAFGATAAFWGTQTWIPARAGQLAKAAGADPIHVSSMAVIILNAAAIVGLIGFALLTDVIGRKKAFILGAVLNMIFLPVVFLCSDSYQTLFLLVPLMGLFTNGIMGVFTPYFPELFPTHLRATGVSFCFNFSRIIAAAGPFIAGNLVGVFGGIPKAASFMAVFYVIGLIAVMFAPETKGKPLPEGETIYAN